MPDIIFILLDGTVRGELAGGRHVQDRHLRPAGLILICLYDVCPCLVIGLKVGKNEVLVCIAVLVGQQGIIDLTDRES